MRALQTGLFALAVGGLIAVTATTTTTGCSNTSQVRQVFMALDGNGDRPRDTFYSDTTQIFCDVVFSAYSADETLDVQFIQTTGELALFEGSNDLHPVQRLWAGGEALPAKGVSTVSFTLQRPTAVDGGATVPFPVGKWKCAVTINGQAAGESDFTIAYPNPDCPSTGGAFNGMSCAAYQGGAQCPVDSNYQPGGTDCTCQKSTDITGDPSQRAWVCP